MGGMSLSLGLGLGAYRSGGFSPRSLFAAGEPGGWYDPSDLTTLFQDTAGTTPVTATGQTVGLLLDKSKGLVLGPELVTNGDFSSDTAWSKNGVPPPVISGGAASWPGTSNSFSLVQNMGLQTGKTYKVTFTVVTATSGLIFVKVNGGGALSQSPNITAPGTYTYYLSSTSADGNLAFGVGSTFIGSIDNISVKELPGNHATQATAASRPILRTGSKIDYDGVDDFLRAVLPNLGINATLVRAVQGVGTTILTGQTIAAGNYDDSTDHCGLLLINRPLTAGETAQITAYMNQKAGV